MERACDSCGTTYEAKRATSKYCSKRCNVRAARAPKPSPALPQIVPASKSASLDLVGVTEHELSEAGRLDTTLGQQALALARRMTSPAETGAAVASMSRELRAVMVEALKGAEPASTWVDEMAARRARRAG